MPSVEARGNCSGVTDSGTAGPSRTRRFMASITGCPAAAANAEGWIRGRERTRPGRRPAADTACRGGWNDDRTVWPSAPATGRCARGNGGNHLPWVDPARDLVISSRRGAEVEMLLARVSRAVAPGG
ncbi:hypothetical protein [Streptomyces akebiae]|uniref:Uncharacterized protein n=1 Tax=Streptomyces akebiae TaxID=2865673 RepID=A0ABX8XIH6_9ACTN|nr:hypothetical protein [Streptomyces akebiae]QYX75403.1 hypothetical protein K1J60_01705 [Streptomyces akebiae]